MNNTKETKPTKADILASFITTNWHYCPIDENVEVKHCCGWGKEECKKCILRNVKSLVERP